MSRLSPPRRPSTVLALTTAVAAFTTFSAVAPAQVTEGTTEVTQEGFATVAVLPENDDTTQASVQGGGLLAGGNARSFAFTSSGRFLIRRDAHQFSTEAALNYAASAVDDDSTMDTTVENYQGRIRYDYFFTKRLAGFLAVQARRDRFQGLDLRLSVDPGFAYYFVKETAINLWGEAGYDFQYDVLTEETLARAEAEGAPREKTETDHNARLFAGYQHTLDDRLKLVTGLEFLKSVIYEDSYRINWSAQLQTSLIKNLSLAVGATTQFNNTPLPGVESLDVTSSLSFVYTLL